MSCEDLISSIKTAINITLDFNLSSLQVICLACHAQYNNQHFSSTRLKKYTKQLYHKITKHYRQQSFQERYHIITHKPSILLRLMEFYDHPLLLENLKSCVKIIQQKTVGTGQSQECPKCVILAALICLQGEEAEVIAGRNWRVLVELGIDKQGKISENSFINDNVTSEGSNYSDLRNFIV